MIPVELIDAALLSARIEARAGVARGWDAATIRQDILNRFLHDIESESYGEIANEAILAAIGSATDLVLEEKQAKQIREGEERLMAALRSISRSSPSWQSIPGKN